MNPRRLTALILTVLLLSTACLASAEPLTTPREETLVVHIGQWGAVSNHNPISGTQSAAIGGTNTGRELVYETLFMYNELTNQGEPLLATGYTWVDDNTIEVALNPAAHWNDGEAFTAKDVVYTYEFGKRYDVSWTASWKYLDSVVAKDDHTVVFTLKKDPYNNKDIIRTFANLQMLPEHVWSKYEADNNNDIVALRNIVNEKPVATGPFMITYWDDTKIVLTRDDNYWGQDASMFGKLTKVKYYTIPIYASNDAGNLALKNNEVDVSQAFIADVFNMWANGEPIRTYLSESPYYIPGSMPSIIFNTTRPGLSDPVVRRAIALSIDYGMIAEMAMCGYTDQIEPSLLLLNTSEANYINKDDEKLAALRWDTSDVAGNVEKAKKLLDDAGYKDVDGDGLREMPDGSKIEWKLECPYGWSDWNSSLEIVAQSAAEIGLNLVTYFPESPVWTNHMQVGDFDIVMNTVESSLDPSQPWSRARGIMGSADVAPIGEMAFWNYGRYTNARADELLELIASTPDKDIDKIRGYYTELDQIYLTDLPSVPLMYRPWLFYTINETYWKGFPVKDDGSNVPPQCAIDGAGIRALYMIEPAK